MYQSLMISAFVSWLVCAANSHAGPSDAQSQLILGKQVYGTWCVDCHGPGPGRYGRGLTGTEALEAKYDGKVPAVLDERTDLTPAFVDYFVRNGVSMMPFFRKTEITDAELAALGAYLSRLNAQLRQPANVKP
jgi:mono/diheme cytochrome c family protein